MTVSSSSVSVAHAFLLFFIDALMMWNSLSFCTISFYWHVESVFKIKVIQWFVSLQKFQSFEIGSRFHYPHEN